MALLSALVLLPLLVCVAGAAYDCPADECQPPSCMCASTEPPIANPPQFVVLTNDDAVTVITAPAVLGMLEKAGGVNRNGCPLPATWYVSVQYTQPEYIQKLYMEGHEMATHTVDHVALPNATEVVGARRWLNETAHVPLEKIRGFRGPFLSHDKQLRDTLEANGFTYDSTIDLMWGPASFCPDGAHQVWPFTMDYGIPIDCSTCTGTCSASERHPGLWEFPVWDVQDDDGTVVASMDPAGRNITELYMRQLLRQYNGNRAPVGVYLHAARLVGYPEVADQYSAFFRAALSLPDVWVVTVSEVLRWMVDPVPASAYNLSCPTPTDMFFPSGHFCMAPTGGCVQGSWNDATCSCACLNQANATLPGFCPNNSTGACTDVKQYNLASLSWYCASAGSSAADVPPAGGSASSPASPASPAPGAAASPSPAAANGSSMPTTSPPSETATVQPLGTVQFSFVVTGEVADFVLKADAVCAVLSALAGEAPSACAIASVTETAAPTGGGARRLASTGYLQVVAALHPANHTTVQVSDSLATAMRNGSLSSALAAVGVQLAPGQSPSLQTLSAAPSSNKATIGAAVGGAIGGAVLVCASVAVFLAVRARRARARHAGVRLPVSTLSQDEAEITGAGKHKASPPAKGLHMTAHAGPSRLGEGTVSAYASTPRGATPRHAGAPFGGADGRV